MFGIEVEDPKQDPEFLQYLIQAGINPSQFSPEELKAMYTDYAGERSNLNRQEVQANAMRDASQAGLGGTQAGNVFVADNPLETIAGAAGTIGSALKNKKLQGAREGLSEQNALARQAYAREQAAALRGGAGNPAAQAGGRPGLTPEMLADMERRRRGITSA